MLCHFVCVLVWTVAKITLIVALGHVSPQEELSSSTFENSYIASHWKNARKMHLQPEIP